MVSDFKSMQYNTPKNPSEYLERLKRWCLNNLMQQNEAGVFLGGSMARLHLAMDYSLSAKLA
jgi:hypothetical protein